MRNRIRHIRHIRLGVTLALITLCYVAGTATASASQVLLGDQNIEAIDDGGTNTSEAFGYTAASSGTATDAEVYLTSTTGVRIGLYADNASRPGALLAQGSVLSNTAGWVDVTLPGGVQIQAGGRYWLAIESSADQRITYRDHGTSGPQNLDYGLNGLQDPASTTNQYNSNPASVYLNGTTVTVAPPIAAFTFSPQAPVTGQAVHFDGTGSTCAATPCSYSWDDEPSGVTPGTYPLGTGQSIDFTFHGVGTKHVTLRVTDAQGRLATVEHNVVVTAAPPPPPPNPVAPSNTAAPQITGTPQQDSTLTVSNGTWSGDTPITYAYQWQDCSAVCTDIGGATSQTYTAQAPDVGQGLDVVVTVTNNAGTASSTSNVTSTVAASTGGGGGSCSGTPPPGQPAGSCWPYFGNTGTPAGWTPASTQSTDLHVTTAGATVQNIRFTNSANLYVDAPNVTVKNDEFQGGSVRNCDNWWNGGSIGCQTGLIVQDTTFDLIPGHVFDDYDLWPGATLNQTLSTSSPVTTLQATVNRDLPAGSDLLVYSDSAFKAQVWTTSAAITTGQTSIPVQSQIPNYAYPAGLNMGSNIQYSCQPSIWMGNYTAERVKVWRRCAAFYSGNKSGGAGPMEVDDSYASLTNGEANYARPADPYHTEAVQGYDSAGITLNNDTMDTSDASHGTSTVFVPGGADNQGNTSLNVNGLLAMNGSNNPNDPHGNYTCCGFVFRDGVPGSVQNLHMVDHTWGYGDMAIACQSLTGPYSGDIVTIDRFDGGMDTSPFNITSTVAQQPCNTSSS